MKKRLFYTLALFVALCLAIPMAALPASANGTTVTTYLDPSWEKTTNYSLDATIAATPYAFDDAYWNYTSTVWDGPQQNGKGITIPGWVANDFWAYWPFHGIYTHYWFKTELEVCGPLLVGVKLVNKYDHSMLSINDDLYVFVNGEYAASGGTAPAAGHTPPYADFVTASRGASTPTETDRWYINGGLSLPKSLFNPGLNTISILTEEFAGWGGMGHLVFEVTYYNANLGAVTPETAYNLVGTDHSVSVNIGNAVAGIPVTFVVTGANPTSGVEDTDSSGTATFTYTGNNPGTDSIYAFIDCNGNGGWDEGEPHSTVDATKYWFQDNFLTGGGTIKVEKKVAWTIAGNIGFLPDGSIVGNFNIVDHANKNQYKAHNTFTALAFSGDPTFSPPASYNIATFTGTFTDKNGTEVELTLTITDNDESGGGADTVEVTGGLTIGPTTLSGGNFQVHDGFKG